MTLTGNQIRQKFLEFFASKEHELVASASLLPQNDPTLYFTNAGMVPFKNLFTGEEKRGYKRATTSQKCMRVSGKHNDLENVGRTERHHTFFEMLGNFSFGDYFKSQAIAFAWEFLTETVKIPKEKLWITVFENDDEAAEIWHREQGVPRDRIIRKDEKDNFWAMGDTGPCGPCSEIHIEKDFVSNPTRSTLAKFDDNKVMEIWNLVFMQFERSTDGKLTPLPKPSIDTGMGLERLAAVLQNKSSNYDTDLFMPLIREIESITQKTYTAQDLESDVSMRVIADHIRATTFLISDGVLPSNEGRGYVLRRIMRRAIRHGKLLGQKGPFFHRIVSTVVQEMAATYPDLKSNQATIEKIVFTEEERFFETLDKGLKILGEEMALLKNANQNRIRGEVAFKLYDTFGFPLDLTQVIADENNLTVDETGFDACMTEQKERARAAWKGSGQDKVSEIYLKLAESQQTVFLGYDTLEAPARVVALVQDGKQVDQVTHGEFEIIFDQTPCYGEGGGQVGDKGHGTGPSGIEFKITDTTKPASNLFLHHAKLKSGTITTGQQLQVAVSRSMRLPTMRNHSATHLLHAALRKILGEHIRQAGSFVNEKGLRFDFSHFEAIPPETLKNIETAVNQVILDNLPIHKEEKSHEEAIAGGALAFFGDKYGDLVRVVSMGKFSVELCGGTHLSHTSEIGGFRILSESSVAAGVRRIEAITGMEALHLAQEDSATLKLIAGQLKTTPRELPDKIEKLGTQLKTLERELEAIKMKVLRGNTDELLKNSLDMQGTKIVLHQAQTDNPKALQELSDVILNKLGSGVAVVSAEIQGRVSLVVSVTKDLESRLPANKILMPLAEAIGGKGGGKAGRAQAGGPNVDGVQRFSEILKTFTP